MNWSFRHSRFICSMGAALLAVVAAAALGGCGSSDSSATADGSTTTITKAELIKQGDAICRETDQVQEAGFATYKKEHGGSAPSKPADEVQLIVKFGLPPVQTEIEELVALGAPNGEEAQMAALIRELKEALKSAEANPKVFVTVGGGPEFNKANELAKKYGFKDCAEVL